MRIFLASYPFVMINRGGPTFKLLQTKKALEELGVEVKFFDMWDTSLKFEKDDLIHIFDASINTYSLAVNLKLKGVKYVVNPIFYNRHSNLMIRNYLRLENFTSKILKGIYSEFSIVKYMCENSEYWLPNTIAEEEIIKKGIGVKNNRSKVIHNGVEKRFAESDASLFTKKYGIKDFVLNVGHIGATRKNSLRFIKAMQKLDVPTIIIANVLKNKNGLQCVEEINKSKNITLIEWVKHDDPLLASAYAACKTFVLPALYETPGRAALEAGLANANVVITPFGGTKEYFGKFAEYCDPYSITSIKKSVEKSLNLEKNNLLKEQILRNFTWEKIALETVKMYQEIIDNS